MCIGKDTESEIFIFNNFIFNNSSEEKILEITIDSKLTSKSHIKILYKNTVKENGGFIKAIKSSKLFPE